MTQEEFYNIKFTAGMTCVTDTGKKRSIAGVDFEHASIGYYEFDVYDRDDVYRELHCSRIKEIY